jgi:hypothetical protein
LKNQNVIIPVVVAVLVGAAAFFGGMQYQKSQAQTNGQFSRNGGQGFRMGMGAGMGRFGNGMGGAVIGQIIGSDDKSITVKLQDGSSKIVLLTDSTMISKTQTTSKSDLTQGANVAVFGSPNSDGSVTAQNVQLNPMFRMRPDGSPMPSGSPK